MSEDKEFLEVETDYDRGVMDERKKWEAKRCETCKHIQIKPKLKCLFDTNVPFGDFLAANFVCIYHEPKGSE